LHLDYEASDDGQLPPFTEWARAEIIERRDSLIMNHDIYPALRNSERDARGWNA
jgi:hypothetical protein